MLRTHTCGELTKQDIENEVTLCGWVHRRRDHGGIIFIDLRDRYGLTQIVFDPNIASDDFHLAEDIRAEYVLEITGKVRPRLEGQANTNMPTGEIEVEVHALKILNTSKVPPFVIDTEEQEIGEELRLKYRYLDIRRERMAKNILLRAEMTRTIRSFFHSEGFMDVETPIMIKGTPEGSREYLVPSRLYEGEFYVLPQSPQQLKQLLMVGGIDKYFQIARCFRDEDQRGDRQPEFTQFELEMSFCEEEDVMEVIERCFLELMATHAHGKKYPVKFPRLTWHEAMTKYGSDKPDLRFDMEFTDLSEESKKCGFGVFENSEHVFALSIAQEHGEFTRKMIDNLTELAKKHGAGGLAWYRVEEESGPVAKFCTSEFLTTLQQKTNAQKGDVVLFGAGDFMTATEPLGAVRSEIGTLLSLKDPEQFAYCWVYNFPMFEQNSAGQLGAMHHPFTRPLEEDRELLKTDPLKARAHAYDIVLNGTELGGGSLRIHEPDLQAEIFEILKISKEDAQARFGHMLEAFQYGAPPHGGCAMGLDRVIMLFADEPNIREVIAFPKNQQAQDLMLGAPSAMPEEQLQELHIASLDSEQ